jgi:hypothetical protein
MGHKDWRLLLGGHVSIISLLWLPHRRGLRGVWGVGNRLRGEAWLVLAVVWTGRSVRWYAGRHTWCVHV